MKWVALAVVALVAAAATGGYAWQQHQIVEQTRAELATARAQADKALADMKAMQTQNAAFRKEAEESRQAAEQLRTELNSARAFLDSERAGSARLRDELAK